MSDKLLSEAENAYVAFKDYQYALNDYQYALNDPQGEHPGVAFWKLEEAISKLGDAIDDVTADANAGQYFGLTAKRRIFVRDKGA